MFLALMSWFFALAYTICIFCLSSSSSPPVPSKWLDYDKVLHTAEYFIFAGLWLVAFSCTWSNRGKKFLSISVLLLSLTYAATDEVHQYFVPMRKASVADWAADALGSSIAIGLFYLYFAKYKFKKH